MTGNSSMNVDSDTVKKMLAQVAELAVEQHALIHPEKPSVEIPAPLKWAGVIMAAIMTAVGTGAAIWVVSTLNSLQVTVARIDERQQAQVGDFGSQVANLDRRVTALEADHREGKIK